MQHSNLRPSTGGVRVAQNENVDLIMAVIHFHQQGEHLTSIKLCLSTVFWRVFFFLLQIGGAAKSDSCVPLLPPQICPFTLSPREHNANKPRILIVSVSPSLFFFFLLMYYISPLWSSCTCVTNGNFMDINTHVRGGREGMCDILNTELKHLTAP